MDPSSRRRTSTEVNPTVRKAMFLNSRRSKSCTAAVRLQKQYERLFLCSVDLTSLTAAVSCCICITHVANGSYLTMPWSRMGIFPVCIDCRPDDLAVLVNWMSSSAECRFYYMIYDNIYECTGRTHINYTMSRGSACPRITR